MYYSATSGGFYDPNIHGGSIPADAKQITQQEHQQLMAAQAAGKTIIASDKGLPVAVDPLPYVPTADGLCQRIDSAADRARAAVAGDALRAVEYDRSRLEAEAYKAAGYQGDVPRMVAAWAINGRTPRQAADSILAEASAYTEALYCIRETRLQAKELIRSAVNAGNIEQAQDIANETVAFIENAVAGIGNNTGT